MSITEFTIRVALAFALGVLIGAERQWRQRMAGLRTNALVSTGAALFVAITALLNDNDSPTRVAAQIVSGIGFLAGAVIFREGLSVRGLNTAATLWGTAAVGTLAGAGFYAQAAIGAIGVLAANVLLRPIVQRINRQPLDGAELSIAYEIVVITKSEHEEAVRSAILNAVRTTTMLLRALESSDLGSSEKVVITANVVTSGRGDAKLERIVGRLSLDARISSASWRVVRENDRLAHEPAE